MSVIPRLDGGSTALLPTYTITAGGTIAITPSLDTTNGAFALGDTYGFAITGTAIPSSGTPASLSATGVMGIQNSARNILPFATTYIGWDRQGTGTASKPLYFTTTSEPFTFNGSTNLSTTFNLFVSPSTPVDVYSLTARLSWLDSRDHCSQGQEFLINVIPEPETLTLLVPWVVVGAVVWRRKRRAMR